MNLQGKKLLILGGAEIHCKVVRAAKELGIHTIVIDNLPESKSPAKQIAAENYEINIYDVQGIIDFCKENHVDGVINTSLDPCQIPQSQVCDALGLPCYGTKEQYYKLTNKVAFKKLCRENGIDVIEDYTEEDVLNDKAIYPLFIKPVDSRGSRGQSICHCKEDALKGIEIARNISTDGSVLIEQYLEGKQDFMLNYIVADGQPNLLRICDRYGGRKEDGLDKVGALAMNPSKYSDMYMANVHDRVCRMIQNLGIMNGPIFLQGFVDGNTVRMYDPGLRLPGGNYENLLKDTTGVDIIKMLVEFSLTGKMNTAYGDLSEDLYRLNGKYVSNLFPMMKQGKISKIVGFDKIVNMPEVVSAALRHEEGEMVEATKTVNQRVGEINIKTDSIEQMAFVIREIYDVLDVLDENGRSLVVSKLPVKEVLGV